jgi:hypothetical protein
LSVVFDGSDLGAIARGAVDASGVRCRFEASTVEGESLDIVLRLAGSESTTFCCCTLSSADGCNAQLIKPTWYDWAISVNGVDLGMNNVTLPAEWYGRALADGGAPAIDAPAIDAAAIDAPASD